MNVTVVVPIFNAAPFLRNCVDSILQQDFFNFELILVNDGSRDESGAICDEYAKADSRLTVVHQRNKGVSAARNAGIDVAKGQWIAFVDADDVVDPGYLDVLYKGADLRPSRGVAVIVGGYYKTKDWHSPPADEISWEPQVATRAEGGKFWPILERMHRLPGYPFAKLFERRTLIRKGLRFREEFRYGEDRLFLLQYLGLVDTIVTVEGALYRHVVTGAGLSAKLNGFIEEYECFQEIAKATYSLFGDRNRAILDKSLAKRLARALSCFYRRGMCLPRRKRLEQLSKVQSDLRKFGFTSLLAKAGFERGLWYVDFIHLMKFFHTKPLLDFVRKGTKIFSS